MGDADIAAAAQRAMDLCDGSTLTLLLDDPEQQALGPVAAGTTREGVWQGTAILPAEQVEVDAVGYRMTPQSIGGRVQAAEGGIVVANEPEDGIFDDGFEPRRLNRLLRRTRAGAAPEQATADHRVSPSSWLLPGRSGCRSNLGCNHALLA